MRPRLLSNRRNRKDRREKPSFEALEQRHLLDGTGLFGDFNNDDVINGTDLDLLLAEVRQGSNNLDFDLTGNGYVTPCDIGSIHGAWRCEYRS